MNQPLVQSRTPKVIGLRSQRNHIAKAMNELRSTIPQNGTSLIKAFEMIDNLEPGLIIFFC
ncbi:MAG: hypothetical protein Ct9H300mP6_08770 [Gammaproteobacteria bacterium]|nr:MAG: hypothetical protein Ct9H300mP6_08770 [Gammaproteobacteria bacterium]